SYWDSANKIEEDAYELVNSRLGYETEHFDIYLYAKNIFDKEYLSAATDMGGYYAGRAGDPQTFGIMLTGRF
ncbi:MAG: TonB-dependent receptor, partial [Proteobacteria bacterium]|nr:TonB-dependent receptor [Pseudomonadota bacterium]